MNVFPDAIVVCVVFPDAIVLYVVFPHATVVCVLSFQMPEACATCEGGQHKWVRQY